MPISSQAQKLNDQPLSSYRTLFATLHAPSLSALVGEFQGEFIGPSWLRRIAAPGLKLAGLGNWWGKRFTIDGQATNLVVEGGQILPSFPVIPDLASSRLDNRPAVLLSYPQSATPFPWPYIVDELRVLDEISLLGMTYLNRPLFSQFALPFLLFAREITFAMSGS